MSKIIGRAEIDIKAALLEQSLVLTKLVIFVRPFVTIRRRLIISALAS
jgi:hypothetical protein